MTAQRAKIVGWGALWRLLWAARRVRVGVGERVTLPTVAMVGLTERHRVECFKLAFRRLDLLTCCLPRPCFYRSYVACIIGRELGFPTKLNLGLRVRGGRRHQAHAWISLKGVILGERTDPRHVYVMLAGGTPAVCYWLSSV